MKSEILASESVGLQERQSFHYWKKETYFWSKMEIMEETTQDRAILLSLAEYRW